MTQSVQFAVERISLGISAIGCAPTPRKFDSSFQMSLNTT